MSEDDLLTPREVAEMLGVSPITIYRRAREGQLTPVFTLGGHRRYRRADVLKAPTEPEAEPDPRGLLAARVYDQGWTIQQVARLFGTSYGAMRRLLHKNTTVRRRGGHPPHRS